jgi:hypothetical protein
MSRRIVVRWGLIRQATPSWKRRTLTKDLTGIPTVRQT